MGLPEFSPVWRDGEAALGALEAAAADPSVFLAPNDRLASAARTAAKLLYDFTAPLLPPAEGSLLELHTAGFDAEQVWLQLELQTNPVVATVKRRLKKSAKKVESEGPAALLPEPQPPSTAAEDRQGRGDGAEERSDSEDEDEEDEDKGEGSMSGDSEGEDEEAESDKERRKSGLQAGSSGREGAVVEDKFLRLEDMEKFLEDAEAAAEGRGSEEEEDDREDNDEEIDALEGAEDQEDEGADEGDEESDEELKEALRAAAKGADGSRARYEDFFGKKSKQPKKARISKGAGSEEEWGADGADEWGEEEEDAGSSGDDAGPSTAEGDGVANGEPKKDLSEMSSHERRMARIAEKAAALERANLEGKDWTMTGEVTAAKRPANSALEVDLDFEHAARPAPVITQEVTASLEDLIKQRIAELKFDDVQRKAPPPTEAPKKQVELDERKSERGLGEIYEEEYVKATAAPGTLAATTGDDVIKKEADALFKALCAKLDALSHFHFAPKPVVEDMSVKADVPALAMEEVAPVGVSDAALLAPEEVYAAGNATAGKKAAGQVKAEEELTKEDRKRRRARKKRVRKAERADVESSKRARLAAKGISLSDTVALAKAKQESRDAKAADAAKPSKAYTKSAQVFAGIQEQREQAAARKGGKGKGEAAAGNKTERRMSYKL